MIRKKTAKKLNLIEMWQYLYEHPGIRFKRDLPERILKKQGVTSFARCPFFGVFKDTDYCSSCPLRVVSWCIKQDSFYNKWAHAKTNKTRKMYAGLILETIKNWEV